MIPGPFRAKRFARQSFHCLIIRKAFNPPRSFDQDIQVSAAQVLGRIEHVLNTEAKVVEQQLRRNEVRLFRGEARFHDPHTVIVTSESGMRRVTAENILIAVGSVPTPPPGAKEDGQTLSTSDGLLQLNTPSENPGGYWWRNHRH